MAATGMTPIHWRPRGLAVYFLIDSSKYIFLQCVRSEGQETSAYSAEIEREHSLPLAQIRLVGEGSVYGTSERLVYSATSARLQYVEHREWVEHRDPHRPNDSGEDVHFLDIVTNDTVTQMEVRCRYCVFGGIPGKFVFTGIASPMPSYKFLA